MITHRRFSFVLVAALTLSFPRLASAAQLAFGTGSQQQLQNLLNQEEINRQTSNTLGGQVTTLLRNNNNQITVPGGMVLATTPDALFAVNVDGGTVVVDSITGSCSFTPTGGSPIAITVGSTGILANGGSIQVMSQSAALNSSNPAIASISAQTLVNIVGAVATIASQSNGNPKAAALLTTVVTAVTQTGATSNNAANFIQAVVSTAVGNDAGAQSTITSAANTGISNSGVANSAALTVSVTTGAAAGSTAAAAAPTPAKGTVSTNTDINQTTTTFQNTVNPSVVSPSS